MDIKILKPTIEEILKTLQLFRIDDPRREQVFGLILKDPPLFSELLRKFKSKD